MIEEMSLEDKIASAVILPRPDKRLCAFEHCNVLLASANKGSLCFRHAQLEKARKYERDCNKSETAEGFRLCDVQGCNTPISNFNLTGRCSEHTWVRVRQPLKTLPPAIPIVDLMKYDVFSSTGELRGTVTDAELRKVRTPVTEEAKKVCGVEGCDTELSTQNKKGRRKLGETPLWARVPLKKMDEPVGQMVYAVPAPTTSDPGFVSLKVPTEALDRFWARMSTDDKLRIIEREMFGS